MHIVENFKGFEEASFNFFRPLSVLIGRNGSGKSNLIEAIELLSAVASGTPLYELADARGWANIRLRGGLQRCPRDEGDWFLLGFDATLPFEKKQRKFSYRVTIGLTPEPRILAESLYLQDPEVLIFETVGGEVVQASSSDVSVRYNNFARGGTKPMVQVSCSRSILSQFFQITRTPIKHAEVALLVLSIQHYLQRAFVFDPKPSAMREYARIGDATLARDGSNLSATLYGLSQSDPESLERIAQQIESIPDFPIKGFKFVTTELRDVMFGLADPDKKTLTDARILSDGTLRAIAVLTAVETAPIRSRVIIEEFDNGLHPSRVDRLVRAIGEMAKRRKLDVLVTTHNPVTLNALSEEQLEGVIIAVRPEPKAPSKLIRLNDLPHHQELLESGRLGDLVTQQVLEQHLRPQFEEERQARSLKWLESLSR